MLSLRVADSVWITPVASCVCSGEMHGLAHGRVDAAVRGIPVDRRPLCTPGFVVSMPMPPGTTIFLPSMEHVEVRVHVVLETLGVSGTRPAATARAIGSGGAGHGSSARPAAPAPTPSTMTTSTLRSTIASATSATRQRGHARRHARAADYATAVHMLSPPKSSLTEPSSNTASIASASSGAIDSTRRVVEALLVGDRQRVGDDDLADRAVLQPVDGRARQQAVRRRDVHVGRAAVDQQVRGAHDGARGVDHVVDDDARAALDVADDLGRDRDVVRALRPALVDERDVGAEPVGEAPGELAAARVGSDDHRVAVDVGCEVLGDHRHRGEVVDRDSRRSPGSGRCAGRR